MIVMKKTIFKCGCVAMIAYAGMLHLKYNTKVGKIKRAVGSNIAANIFDVKNIIKTDSEFDEKFASVLELGATGRLGLYNQELEIKKIITPNYDLSYRNVKAAVGFYISGNMKKETLEHIMHNTKEKHVLVGILGHLDDIFIGLEYTDISKKLVIDAVNVINKNLVVPKSMLMNSQIKSIHSVASAKVIADKYNKVK